MGAVVCLPLGWINKGTIGSASERATPSLRHEIKSRVMYGCSNKVSGWGENYGFDDARLVRDEVKVWFETQNKAICFTDCVNHLY